MANPAIIVRLLWNAARATGAYRAAQNAGTGRELARNIVKLANQLRKTNDRLQQLRDTDTEQIAAEIERQGVSFMVQGQRYACGANDLLNGER